LVREQLLGDCRVAGAPLGPADLFDLSCRRRPASIPACFSGFQFCYHGDLPWIPACAGMTSKSKIVELRSLNGLKLKVVFRLVTAQRGEVLATTGIFSYYPL